MSRPRPRRSFMSLGGLAMALATFGCPAPSQTHEPLTLRAEKKLAKLYGGGIDRYEASGVTLQDGALRMVLDNSSHVPTVGLDLSSGALGAGRCAARTTRASPATARADTSSCARPRAPRTCAPW